jgi:hypothetical protein
VERVFVLSCGGLCRVVQGQTDDAEPATIGTTGEEKVLGQDEAVTTEEEEDVTTVGEFVTIAVTPEEEEAVVTGREVPTVEEEDASVSGVSSSTSGTADRTEELGGEAAQPSMRLRIDCATDVCRLQDNRAQALPAYAL